MLGERLQELRTMRNLSLSELAKRAKVAKSYLSAMERHIQQNPSLHVLERLANVLDVPIQYLLSETYDELGTDAPPSSPNPPRNCE